MIEYQHFLQAVEPSRIPSSTAFPVELMKKYLPDWYFTDLRGVVQHGGRGRVLDWGSGSGKMLDRLHEAGFGPYGFDINTEAVARINELPERFAHVMDVTRFGSHLGLEMIGYIENSPAVLWQALGPSLLGTSWRKALYSADVALEPGGYLCIADFVRADLAPYAEIPGGHGIEDWRRNQTRWQRRLEVNMRAFGDLTMPNGEQFPYGAVAVAQPGIWKEYYDWCLNPHILRAVYDRRDEPAFRNVFERFAQNMDWPQVRSFLFADLHYTLLEEMPVEWPSRTNGQWYPGVIAVYQKPHMYRYHPYKLGLDPRATDYWDTWKARKHAIPPLLEWTLYFQRFLDNLSVWNNDQPAARELAETMFALERKSMSRLWATA